MSEIIPGEVCRNICGYYLYAENYDALVSDGLTAGGQRAKEKGGLFMGKWIWIMKWLLTVVLLVSLFVVGCQAYDGWRNARDSAEAAQIPIGLEALRKVNGDVVGWIEIPGTELSYPLMQGEDINFICRTAGRAGQTAAARFF